MANILIVDDNPRNLKAYRISLEEDLPEMSIITAPDEYEAIKIINSNILVDVIITDLMMKREDSGIIVLNAAKQRDPLIMVIIITAYDKKLDRKEAYELGAFDCLEKGSAGVKTADELVYKTKSALYTRKIAKDLIDSQRKMDFFKRYFDPLVFQKIEKEPKLLLPQNRIVTIVFWDIRGFSSLSEKLKSNTNLIADFLKEFLEIASKVIFQHNGILDKFIGDGVMAIFGAFEFGSMNEDKNAVSAMKAAISLNTEFSIIYNKWIKIWQRFSADNIDIGLGCGIHTGEALVGNLGTENRDHFTAIGPHVNLASRIERTSGKGEIRFSTTTKARIDEIFLCRKVERLVNIKNINGEFDVFEIIDS